MLNSFQQLKTKIKIKKDLAIKEAMKTVFSSSDDETSIEYGKDSYYSLIHSHNHELSALGDFIPACTDVR